MVDGVGSAQVITVTCVADSSGSLDGKAFYFNTPNRRYMVFIKIETADGKNIDGVSRIGSKMRTVDDIITIRIDEGTSNSNVILPGS